MQTVIILFQLVVLGFVPRASEAQEFSAKECQLYEAEFKKQCFQNRDLYLTEMPPNLEVLMPPYEHYETFFTIMDPGMHCQDPAKYREAVACALNVTRQCFDPDGSLGITATYEDTVAGMDRLCELKDQVDVNCFKTFFNTAVDCGTFKRLSLGLNLISVTQKELTCKSTELLYDCMEVVLKPLCGLNTTRIYMEQVGNYQLPQMCKNGSEPTQPRERYFQELRDDANANANANSNERSIAISTTFTTTTTTTASLLLVAVSSARWLRALCCC